MCHLCDRGWCVVLFELGIHSKACSVCLQANPLTCHLLLVWPLIATPPQGLELRDLFAPLPDPRRARMMAVMDRVNAEFGRGTLRLASEQLQRD